MDKLPYLTFSLKVAWHAENPPVVAQIADVAWKNIEINVNLSLSACVCVCVCMCVCVCPRKLYLSFDSRVRRLHFSAAAKIAAVD